MAAAYSLGSEIDSVIYLLLLIRVNVTPII